MRKWRNRLVLGSLALLPASLPALAAESKILSPTHMWNEIWTEVLYDLLLIGVPFGLAALYMMIRYRAKSPGQVGEAVNLSPAAVWDGYSFLAHCSWPTTSCCSVRAGRFGTYSALCRKMPSK